MIPAADRVARARVQLLIKKLPFYGMLLMGLETTASTVNNTCWTDGNRLGYCPEYVDSVSDDELITTLAHEAEHVALAHHFRLRPHHNAKRANVAMDHAVNLNLSECRDANGNRMFTIPSTWFCDPQYTGMSWEEIYNKLPDDDAGQGSGPGEVRPAPDGTEQERQEAEAEHQARVMGAAQAAAAHGTLPGHIQRLVESMKKPVVHWPDVLRQFLTRSTTETTWKTPRRRALAGGMYLPSKTGQKCPPLAIAVDTSCSITPAMLDQFSAEISAILADVNPERVHVICCDSKVNDVADYEPHDLPIKLSPCGGGGTDFQPPFDWVESNLDEPPAALVYLTDLECTPPREPDYPVLWVSTNRHARSMPFGERVDMLP